jgi:hypothetical protein
MTQTAIPAAWKKTLIVPLVRIMFDGADGDLQSAWDQAIQLVQCYAPKTEQELRMFVRMTILNAQANLSFAESVDPDATRPQAIRLRTNGLALAKAADKAEQRFRQLQTARAQKARNAAPAPEETPTSEEAPASAKAPETPSEAAPRSQTAKDEIRAINEYARKHNLSYPEAWAHHERRKKAVKAQAPTTRAQTAQA